MAQAGLVEVNPRKVRARMRSGQYHITSSGSEYLKMMQKVIDAESTDLRQHEPDSGVRCFS